MNMTYQAVDSNPAYETTRSTLESQATDRKAQNVDDEELRSNSVDQLDDYDYMG